jgi:site-specific recombinase XerD
LAIAIESFLIYRRASGCAKGTIEFYKRYLKHFSAHCEHHAITLLQDISVDFLRQYLLLYSESHNPGGVHAIFRTLRAFFRWLEFEEVMPDEWKNPIHKVKSPKVPREPIQPVSLEDVQALIDSCKDENNAQRDKAIFLCLLDTGVRASELCNIDLEYIDWGTGAIVIKQGKG